MPVTRIRTESSAPTITVDERLRIVLQLHLHSKYGSTYWLRKQEQLGWDILDRIRSMSDVWQLGPTTSEDLRTTPVRDFLPRIFHRELERFVIGETAGTSGRPCITAYRHDEFDAAFITPFLRVAEWVGFPRNASWLWVGPSGPHIIGKVVRELARRTGGMDPYSVDFDPRWAKKLIDGSMARQRYLEHVTSQAMDILEREPIEVLFTTPPALTALAARMSERQRLAIKGLHYGGMKIAPEAVNQFRLAFPNAIHLAGYGNTLFGVVMELADETRTAMDYYPLSDRVLFELVTLPESRKHAPEPVDYGERGRLIFHRLDESVLLLNVVERDEAERIPANTESLALGSPYDGLRDPGPPTAMDCKLQLGLY